MEGLAQAGFLEARGGKVRLLRRDELLPPRPFNGRGEGGEGKYWGPQKDKRLTAWDPAQYPIRALDKESEQGAGV